MTGRSPQPQFVVVYGDGSSCPDADTVTAAIARGASFREIPEEMRGGKVGDGFRSENVPEQIPGGLPPAARAKGRGHGGGEPVHDPHRIHRDFPDKWQAYIRANYRNLMHVQQVFGVSERTARSWWKGETGANGGHVAIAVSTHPVAAPRMLFAAE